MLTINGLTKEAMEAIRDGVIVDAHITSGHLILVKFDDSTIDAGNVIGPTGPEGPEPPRSIEIAVDEGDYPEPGDRFSGQGVWQQDINALYFWNGTEYLMPHAGLPHSTARNETTDTTGTTSGDYVGFAHVVEINHFFKKHNNSHIVVQYAGSVRNDNPWGEYCVGVHCYDEATTGTVFSQQKLIVDGYGDFGAKSGFVELHGDTGEIPAGYYNFHLIKKRGNGTGTVYDGQNNTNTNSMLVTETF
jgi:hypothetical protein